LISSAKRFITSVFAANSPVLSVMAEPPIFRITGFASFNFLCTFTFDIMALIEKHYREQHNRKSFNYKKQKGN
jgi:hypothetical protein